MSPNGDNCSVPCRHPPYGARCESRCNCFKEDYHHVHECPVTSDSCLTKCYSYFSKVPLGAYLWLNNPLLLCRRNNVKKHLLLESDFKVIHTDAITTV